MEAVEFRVSPDGIIYYKQGKAGEKRLTRFCRGICEEVLGIIHDRFPGAWSRLSLLYKQRSNTPAEKDKVAFSIVERFIRCNFGEHDLLTPDIDRDIVHFEEVRCPLRGMCQDENIICKPQSLYELTPAEKEVASLYLRGETFNTIAQQLGKSPSTVKQQLWRLKNKLGAKNCREIIRVLRIHNI